MTKLERNELIINHYIRTKKPYSDVAKDLNLSPDTVAGVLSRMDLKAVQNRLIQFDHSWFKEPEIIEIPVKVSVIGEKVVHLIPSRINFES